MLRACAALAVPAAVLFSTKSASAQGWMKDRRFQEGAGIRAGDLELHPGIGGEIGYDSNWFLRSHKTDADIINGNPRAGGILRVTPSFSVQTLGAQRTEQDGVPVTQARVFQLRGTVAATYREFIGAQELRDQRNISGNAAVRADINRGRPVAFAVFAGYQRLIQPAVVANPNLSFNRSDVNGGAEVTFMPGGGTLDLRGSYQILAALYEESNGVPFTHLQHEIGVRNRWRFRPRTALFHDTSLRFINYPNADRAFNYLNDSTPVRTRFGLTGLLTERFGTTLAVGYGATFFRDPAARSSVQFDSVLAQAEGTFYLSQTPGAGEPGQTTMLLSTLTFGYLRDFQNSLLGNFYVINKGYARAEYWFGGRAVVSLDGYFEAQSFPPVFVNAPGATPVQVTNDFTNYRFGGLLFGEYRLSDSVGINTTLDYSETISDTRIPAGASPVGGPTPPTAQFYDLNWRRIQAFVGARWFF